MITNLWKADIWNDLQGNTTTADTLHVRVYVSILVVCVFDWNGWIRCWPLPATCRRFNKSYPNVTLCYYATQVVYAFLFGQNQNKRASLHLIGTKWEVLRFGPLPPCDFGFIFMGHVLLPYLMLHVLIYLLFLIHYPPSLFIFPFSSFSDTCMLWPFIRKTSSK